MAALTLITATPTAASPTCWTHDERAVVLLASCAKNMPKGRYVRTDWERDDTFIYVGTRAEKLAAIREELGATVLRECDGAGDYSEFTRYLAMPTVVEAIDAAPLKAIYAEVEAFVAAARANAAGMSERFAAELAQAA